VTNACWRALEWLGLGWIFDFPSWIDKRGRLLCSATAKYAKYAKYAKNDRDWIRSELSGIGVSWLFVRVRTRSRCVSSGRGSNASLKAALQPSAVRAPVFGGCVIIGLWASSCKRGLLRRNQLVPFTYSNVQYSWGIRKGKKEIIRFSNYQIGGRKIKIVR
jgi:hypothetical protein